MNRDMFMDMQGFPGWDYGIIYDDFDKEYVIAEIYYNKKGDASSWCMAVVASMKYIELKSILKELSAQAENGSHFIAKDNKIIKVQGGAS